jgi:hypothetical protein
MTHPLEFILRFLERKINLKCTVQVKLEFDPQIKIESFSRTIFLFSVLYEINAENLRVKNFI